MGKLEFERYKKVLNSINIFYLHYKRQQQNKQDNRLILKNNIIKLIYNDKKIVFYNKSISNYNYK